MLDFLSMASELSTRLNHVHGACPRNYAVICEDIAVHDDIAAFFDLITDTPMFAAGDSLAVSLANWAMEA